MFKISFIISFISLFAVATCDFNDYIGISDENMHSKQYVISTITKVYDKNELNEIIKKVNTCNNQVNNSVKLIDDEIDNLNKIKKELSSQKTIKFLIKKIETTKAELEDAKSTMRDKLDTIGYEGLFFTTLDEINPLLETQASLIKKSMDNIKPIAVKNISNIAKETIKRLNHIDILDIIEQNSSGDIEVIKEIQGDLFNGQNSFLYFAKVKVYPTKNRANLLSLKEDRNSSQKAYELKMASNIENVPEEFRQSVFEYVQKESSAIYKNNSESDLKYKIVLDEYDKSFTKYSRELSLLNSQLKDINNTTNKIFQDIDFDCNTTLEMCIDNAEVKIVNKIAKLQRNRIFEKSNELKYDTSSVVSNDEPKADIAKKAIDQATKIVLKYKDIVSESIGIEKSEDSFKFRDLDRFYIFPINGIGNEFNLTIIVKFKLVKSEVIRVIDKEGNIYKEIKSPYTSRVWLDRNLGSKNVCDALSDIECFGDYYQWGRGDDGHQKKNSLTKTIYAKSSIPKHGEFIKTKISNSDNWIDKSYKIDNKNFWSDVEQGGANNPCPKGYRVPTIKELEAETISLSQNNKEINIREKLKLPLSGYRHCGTGDIRYKKEFGDLWSSSTSGQTASYLEFDEEFNVKTNKEDGFKGTGMAIRCIKN